MSFDEKPLDDIEQLLASVKLQKPATRLDKRMESVFRYQRVWHGAAAGFAAGALLTLSVMHAMRPAPKLAGMADPGLQPAHVAPGSYLHLDVPATTQKMDAVARVQVDAMYGQIDGTPVRIERRRQLIELSPNDQPADNWRADVACPDVITISKVEAF